MTSWKAWSLDAATWAFIAWWVWFFAWESAALINDNYDATWTAHFRPLFVEISFTWFLGQAILIWFWVHTFYPALERWIIRTVG